MKAGNLAAFQSACGRNITVTLKTPSMSVIALVSSTEKMPALWWRSDIHSTIFASTNPRPTFHSSIADHVEWKRVADNICGLTPPSDSDYSADFRLVWWPSGEQCADFREVSGIGR